MNVGIQDEILRINALGLLPLLLADKTTGKNILWATDAYAELGESYQRNREILPALITGANGGVIKNRARKNLEQQTERTKSHAEVFTPLWVCAKMNDYADEAWFGKKELFFKDGEPTEKIIFPKKKRWQPYVDSRRLELTCGEAPYLVSRYDVATGEGIPLKRRIGILDRKLRAVEENTAAEEEWLQWTLRAFKATYGYEFQGDNLLIARVNLLMTFEEYLQKRWQRSPTPAEYKKVINIIVWNLWQMDGLTGKIPYSGAKYSMDDIFAPPTDDAAAPGPIEECKIKNWPGERSVKFKELPIGGKKAMKFDFIIGNPPYQESDGGAKASARPIYPNFINAVKSMSPRSFSLIIPARWFSGGKSLDAFRESILSDKHVRRLIDYFDSTDCFVNADISGGVCILVWNRDKEGNCIVESHIDGRSSTMVRPLREEGSDIFIRFNEAVGIYRKVKTFKEKSFATIVSARKPFGISTNIPLSTEKTNEQMIKAYAFPKNGYVVKDVVTLHQDWIYKNKVCISYAYGERGDFPYQVIGRPFIAEAGSCCTETYLVVSVFDDSKVAKAIMKYMMSKFFRFLVLLKKNTQHATSQVYSNVPLQNFTSSSDIDWSKTVAEIDRQLYAKYKLSKEEIDFIETHVKEMA